MTHEPLVSYIKRAGSTAQLVTSVCTGAMLLHAAGFLEGSRATTHWAAKQELRDLGGNVEIIDGERWVHDGNVITAAGVSAGIDMALYLVGQLKSPEDARKVQSFMEYQPAPPYAQLCPPANLQRLRRPRTLLKTTPDFALRRMRCAQGWLAAPR